MLHLTCLIKKPPAVSPEKGHFTDIYTTGGGGSCSGALWKEALTVKEFLCGKEALFATKTPGSDRLDNTTRSSRSVDPDGSLKDGSGAVE